MISLLADSRIRFLMGFVIVAVVLAIVLILIEIFLKERERQSDKITEQTPADRIKIYIDSGKSLQEKLAYLNKVAKEYFRDMYDFSLTASYSTLAKDLEKRGKKNEIEFCNKMFEIFYSKKGLNKVTLNSLGKLLTEIEGHRTVERKIAKPVKKTKVGILSKGVEDALGVHDIKTEKVVIKNPEDEIERAESKKIEELSEKESLGKEKEKKLEVEEACTKKRLKILEKHDDRQHQKEEQILELKKRSEARVVERKKLVDERRSKRTDDVKERKIKDVLIKKEKKDRKDRKREAFWKAKAEKTATLKLKEQERTQVKRLEMEKRSQELEEKKRLDEIKIESAISETAKMTKAEQNKIDKINLETEGIAARIVRLEKERLEREGVH